MTVFQAHTFAAQYVIFLKRMPLLLFISLIIFSYKNFDAPLW